MCHFHGYSEEKAPFPCDDKLPPAKMSAYRYHFDGYIAENGPKYKLTCFSRFRLHVGVRANPNLKALPKQPLQSFVYSQNPLVLANSWGEGLWNEKL